MQVQPTQASTTPLSLALHATTTDVDWATIAQRLWGINHPAAIEPKVTKWESYFAYYSEECSRASSIDQGIHLAAKTHEDIGIIADILRSNLDIDAARQEFRRVIAHGSMSVAGVTMTEGSLKLVTRLLTMVNIGGLSTEISSQLSLDWNVGSLKDCIHTHFNKASQNNFDNTILGPDLTVRQIRRMTRIAIKPTNNLLDHLRVVEQERTICVFHHISFLRYMEAINCPMFPDGFVKETIDTLILLFPDNNKKNKKWMRDYLRSSTNSVPLDSGLSKTGHFQAKDPSRDLRRYHFWHDRLGVLKEAVEGATPPAQAFKKALSNSKGDGWINSWIGVVAIGLTLFFGLVQSIEGAIQVYKAYH